MRLSFSQSPDGPCRRVTVDLVDQCETGESGNPESLDGAV
jgi:hypothetical protein